jgi:hypothetical protein
VPAGEHGDGGGRGDGLDEVIKDLGADFVDHLAGERIVGLVGAPHERHRGKCFRHLVVHHEPSG